MGDAAGTAAPPGVLTERQEGKFLNHIAREGLKSLRWNWGDAYGLGVLPGGTFAAWRKDGKGGTLTAEDPEELNRIVRADYCAEKVERS